jgi:hypothetical protein
MFSLKDAHHFRKLVAGMCMVMAPLLLLVGEIVHPERKTDVGDQLAVIAANQDAWYAAHLLEMVAMVLFVPVILGLMHMMREREPALSHIGGGLAIVGLMATTALVSIEGFVGWQAGAQNSPEMTALFRSLTETTGIVIPVFVMSYALTLGVLVMMWGLYRAKAVPIWVAGSVAIAVLCLAVAGTMASDALSIIGALFLAVGIGTIGRMVVSESDEDWEHTPEFKGITPLAGSH